LDTVGSEMKFLLLATYDWYMYNFKLPIAEELRERGHEVVLVTPPGEYAEKMKSNGYRVRKWQLDRHSMNPLKEIRSVLHLLLIYAQERPSVAHHFTAKGILYGSIAATVTGISSVVNAVTGGASAFGNVISKTNVVYRGVQWGLKRLFQFVLAGTGVIFQNPDDLESFVSQGLVAEERCHLIKGSGVDLSSFQPAPEPEGTPNILLAGRLLWNKGVGEFVEASRILAREGESARFVLVGNTDSSNPMSVSEEQINEWEQDGLVEWWGFQEDMPSVFGQMHIVCSPSYYREGVPKVLIEAAACERPIVTTDMPGCREIVRDGVNGLLVTPEDSQALASALSDLLENTSRRQAMGARGREIVRQEFSVEQVVSETMTVYKGLAEESRATAQSETSAV
jgi:glycosyltransferase involved in cell wall biosynthesis